jgi:3D (Asp-Asp-Asp) domain-containing protein
VRCPGRRRRAGVERGGAVVSAARGFGRLLAAGHDGERAAGRQGLVAVDPKLIPLRARLFVPGYGKAVAADVGTAVKGRIIDLWFPTKAEAHDWGRRSIVITVYRSTA